MIRIRPLEISKVNKNQKSTIGFLCGSTSWGGLEMNVLRLARWLADRQWPVVVYGTGGSPLAAEAERRQLTFYPIARVGKYGGILSGRRLQRLLEAHAVQILTIHTSRDILMAAIAKKLAGERFKLVFVQHMQIGSDKTDVAHTLEYRALDAWVTPLEILATGIKERTRYDSSKIHVIPYGIEMSRFRENKPSGKVARNTLGLPDGVIIAGVVGRFDPKKGQDVLVRAAKQVHSRGHTLHLLFVGDETMNEQNGYLQTVRRIVADMGLQQYVHFYPFLDAIESAYAAMDIFVLTSHSETYGMVTIEAMASELPIIATDSGGTPGIIANGVNGLLVPPEEPAGLAEALCQLIEDPELSRRLAQQAGIDAVSTYSNESQCWQFEQLFNDLKPTRS